MDIIADGGITAGIVAIGTIGIGAIVTGVTTIMAAATTIIALTRGLITVPTIVGRSTASVCAGGNSSSLTSLVKNKTPG
jgi:hypothetical protein